MTEFLKPGVIPHIEVTVSMSDSIYDLILKGARLWNQQARLSLGEELKYHHKNRIPGHFKLGARGKYGYQRRRLSTERAKQRRGMPGNLDLVKSGQARKEMVRKGAISFRGRFGNQQSAGGRLEGRLTMRWPHPMRGAVAGGLDHPALAAEIVTTTVRERYEIQEGYLRRLVMRMNERAGPMRKVRELVSKW